MSIFPSIASPAGPLLLILLIGTLNRGALAWDCTINVLNQLSVGLQVTVFDGFDGSCLDYSQQAALGAGDSTSGLQENLSC
jgi:hypothetical protein